MNPMMRRRMAWALGIAAAFGLAVLVIAERSGAQVTGPGWALACVGRYGGVRIVLPPNTACVTGETPFVVFGGRLASGRFIDFGLTVLDSRTNLQWEKKTGADGQADFNNLHDVDNTYKWCDATGGSGDVFCNPPPLSWIAAVKAQNFAGHGDWRVPTKDELLTILDTPTPGTGGCTHSPCIDPIFGFTGEPNYWSATEFDLRDAWAVVFANGFAGNAQKSIPLFVRAVRTGP